MLLFFKLSLSDRFVNLKIETLRQYKDKKIGEQINLCGNQMDEIPSFWDINIKLSTHFYGTCTIISKFLGHVFFNTVATLLTVLKLLLNYKKMNISQLSDMLTVFVGSLHFKKARNVIWLPKYNNYKMPKIYTDPKQIIKKLTLCYSI